MKIALASDLHVEVGIPVKGFERVEADVLILAGDIINAEDLTLSEPTQGEFLKELCSQYRYVIYVLGNHEYWESSIGNAEIKINNFLNKERITNCYCASKGYVKIEDVDFVFATLWTDINKGDYIQRFSGPYMKDFQYVTFEGKEFCMKHMMDLHQEHKQFIADTVSGKDNVVVVTHHGPHLKSTPMRDQLKYFYACTDMDDLILDNPQIKYWLHGHVHCRLDYEIGDTKVVTNCHGYTGYDWTVDTFELKIIEV